ncbi:hypothetical protein IPG36_05715 [bacterium]|nr:MAG: hypothetical protein IPG36_05715 [bacterium]
MIERFTQIVKLMPTTGRLIVCAESATAVSVAQSSPCDVITYGFHDGDYQARNIAYLPAGIEFDVVAYGNVLGKVALPIFGRHNVLNSLAAIAAVLKEGLDLGQVINGAADFRGSYRRFNRLTTASDAITVIDDYAHHPTEVAATLRPPDCITGTDELSPYSARILSPALPPCSMAMRLPSKTPTMSLLPI